jgi:hypothetical protein
MQVFRALCVAWVVLVGVASARADLPPLAAPVAPSDAPIQRSLAVGTNLPILWTNAYSIAGSLSVNLSARHAIRANVASYAYDNILPGVIAGLAGGEELDRGGRTTDLGISWVFYPRRLWDGFLLEAGALHRTSEVTLHDQDATLSFTDTRTTKYAGRVMIGWSWLLDPHFFIAAAVGVSAGWGSGTEVSRSGDGSRMLSTPIAREETAGEGYLRFGAVIGL